MSQPTRNRRRALVVGLLVSTLAVPQLLASNASGDAIGDKRAQARRIAARLDSLQQESEILAEDYNNAQIQLARVRGRVSAARAGVHRTDRQIEKRRRQLARYAVSAYTGGGGDGLDLVLSSKGSDLPVREGYASAAVGDKADLVDALRAAKSDGVATVARLRSAQKQADDATALVDKKRKETAAAVSEQRQLYERVQGELKTLVAAEQARRAAQQRARAEAAARAAVARARAAARAAVARATERKQPRTVVTEAPKTHESPPAPASTSRTTTTTTTRHAPRPSPVPTIPPAPPVRPTRAPAPTPAPAPPPAPAPAPVGQGAAAAIAAARSVLGVRYTWAGASPSTGFDCSGLVMWAWAHGGKSLSHSSSALYAQARKIPLSAIQPGDLIFYGSPVHHVGLYIGGGQMIHAPHTGSFVQVESIYYWSALVGAGRV